MLAAVVFVGAGVAQAQPVDVNTSAALKANVGVGQTVGASTTVNANVNVNSTVNGNSGVITASTSMNGNSTSSSSGASSNGNSVNTTTSSAVRLSAREIRGWSDDEKSAFLLTVKGHAQLQSDQDLENFAKGVIAADANVEAVVADDSHVRVSYKLPARFLGIFATEIDAVANVSFDEETNANSAQEVSVKFPWYKMFYSLDSDTRAEVLETAVESSVSSDNSGTSASVASRNGKTIQLISDTLKGVRASMEVSGEATVE